MSRRHACGLVLCCACGGGDPEVEACMLAPGEAIHAASYTDASTHAYAPDQLVADDEYVYFADGRAIHRVPRCGGEAEVLIADARPFNDGLVLADGALYWLADEGPSGSRVLRAPVSGGEPTVLAEYTGYSHRIRADGETVVWNAAVSGFPDEAQIHAVNSDGSEPRMLARHRYGWNFDLADGVLYTAGYLPGSDPDTSDRLLFALPVDGGEPTVLVDGFGDEYPGEVVVGGEDVYYLRFWSTDALAIERVARTGGAARTLELGGAAVPNWLLFADGRLYGVDFGESVVRIVDGEAPAPLIAADALEVMGPVFADAGGVLIGDTATRCVEWFMDPSGEPPGMSCVRETIDVRVLSLGR